MGGESSEPTDSSETSTAAAVKPTNNNPDVIDYYDW